MLLWISVYEKFVVSHLAINALLPISSPSVNVNGVELHHKLSTGSYPSNSWSPLRQYMKMSIGYCQGTVIHWKYLFNYTLRKQKHPCFDYQVNYYMLNFDLCSCRAIGPTIAPCINIASIRNFSRTQSRAITQSDSTDGGEYTLMR